MKVLKFASVILMVVFSVNLYAISTDEAYASIPHKRTVYESGSLYPYKSQRALELMFDLVERAIVIKVEGSDAITVNNPRLVKKAISDYDMIINQLTRLEVPPNIQSAHDKILVAIQKHQDFFKIKLRSHDQNEPLNLTFTAEVKQASELLIEAYNILLREFSSESVHNKTAFYDYLCALDFL